MLAAPLPDWIGRLPAPVARARRVLQELRDDPAVDPWRTLSVLKDTFECLLQFAAAVALQEALAAGERNERLRRSILGSLARPGAGAWQHYLDTAFRHEPAAGSARAALRAWLAARLDDRLPGRAAVRSALWALIDLRNVEFGHHATGAEQSRHRELVDAHGPVLDACLQTFVACHEGWRLVVADEADSSDTPPAAAKATGAGAQPTPAAAGAAVSDHAVWRGPAEVRRPSSAAHLPSLRSRGAATAPRSSSTIAGRNATCWSSSTPAHRCSAGSQARIVRATVRLRFDRQRGVRHGPVEEASAHRFTGRTAGTRTARLVDEDPGSSSSTGGRASAKRALREAGRRAGRTTFIHFVRRRGSSARPGRTAGEAGRHLDRFAGTGRPDPYEPNDTALRQLLELADGKGPFAGRLVLVLDGLDESDPAGALLSAIDPLLGVRTPHVTWVLSGRARNPMVRDWLEGLERAGYALRRMELGRLEPDDVRRYLTRHLRGKLHEERLREVERRSGGNALSLR